MKICRKKKKIAAVGPKLQNFALKKKNRSNHIKIAFWICKSDGAGSFILNLLFGLK